MAMNTHTTSPIQNHQAHLISLAYTLTGDRNDARNLLRDTTRIAMNSSAENQTEEGLFRTMQSIYEHIYKSKALSRRVEVSSRAYSLPDNIEATEGADEVPAGTVSIDEVSGYFKAILDKRYNRAITMRAAGYRYSEIARKEGISTFRARVRVALASVSLRAAAALR
ncbi:MAG: hypothetical protein HDR92_06000 [Bacteroides sp.]|nr:hypothetical protein [Bacteroides sp.]